MLIDTGDRFADRLGIGGIILLPFDVGLNVRRGHQPLSMPDRLVLARPMMRCCACFNSNKARLQFLEERHDVAALQQAADDHVTCRIDAVD